MKALVMHCISSLFSQLLRPMKKQDIPPNSRVGKDKRRAMLPAQMEPEKAEAGIENLAEYLFLKSQSG
jgi:hypothetical protein